MKTKLKSKKWKSLISGVLLAASASSFGTVNSFAQISSDILAEV